MEKGDQASWPRTIRHGDTRNKEKKERRRRKNEDDFERKIRFFLLSPGGPVHLLNFPLLEKKIVTSSFRFFPVTSLRSPSLRGLSDLPDATCLFPVENSSGGEVGIRGAIQEANGDDLLSGSFRDSIGDIAGIIEKVILFETGEFFGGPAGIRRGLAGCG